MQTGKQIKHKNTQPNQFGSGVMGVIKIGALTHWAHRKNKRPEFTGRLRMLHRLNTDTLMR